MSGSFDVTTMAIRVRQGETLSMNFTHRLQSDNSPVNISGDHFILTIKHGRTELLSLKSGAPAVDPTGSNPFDSNAAPTASSISILDGAVNRWQLSLSAVRTGLLPAGLHSYEIDRVQSDGTVTTILFGDFEVVRGLN